MQLVIVICGAIAFILVVVYLVSMARFASLLQRETGIGNIGLGAPNAQLGLIRAVFLEKNLSPTFTQQHSRLLLRARASGTVGLVLFVFVFIGMLTGAAG